jgi:hypothetical protein
MKLKLLFSIFFVIFFQSIYAKEIPAFPHNQFIYVQYEEGYCPDNHCQLIYYDPNFVKNSLYKTVEYENYLVFASKLIMETYPDYLRLYDVYLIVGIHFKEIVATQGVTNTEFYQIEKKPEISYSPLSHAQLIVGYDSKDSINIETNKFEPIIYLNKN